MRLQHQPVLLQEVLQYLVHKPDGHYIDATFGRGGHSRAILNALKTEGSLLAIDKDPEAIAAIDVKLRQDQRFTWEQGGFDALMNFALKHHLMGKVAGILLDVGVSSPQLDDPKRGFSFLQDGPLDMRMDPTTGITAANWLNSATEKTIAEVLKNYGEERFAKRIANAIVTARKSTPIQRSLQLAEIVSQANPAWEKHKHPATRSFQAIRIYINRELEALAQCLEQCLEVLAVGGRLVVISFHSLEDRLVKRFIRQHERGEALPKELPVTGEARGQRLKKIKGAIKASAAEVTQNPRARSAVMRVAEKIA